MNQGTTLGGPRRCSCTSPVSDGASTPDAGLAANLLAWKDAWKSRKMLHGLPGRKRPTKEWSLHRRKMAWSENIMRGMSPQSGGSCPGIRESQQSAGQTKPRSASTLSATCRSNSASCPELGTLAPEAPHVSESSPAVLSPVSLSPTDALGVPGLLSPTDSDSISSLSNESIPIKLTKAKGTKSPNRRKRRKTLSTKSTKRCGGLSKRKQKSTNKASLSRGKPAPAPAIQPRWK